MDELTQGAFASLITARVEVALKGLKDNAQYNEICKIQERNAKEIKKIINKLENDNDGKKVRDYYDDEVHKFTYELDEVYIRGFKDCFKLFEFLKDDEMCI